MSSTNALSRGAANRPKSTTDFDAELRELRQRIARPASTPTAPVVQSAGNAAARPLPVVQRPPPVVGQRGGGGAADPSEEWTRGAVSVLQFLTKASTSTAAVETPPRDFAEGYVKAAAQDFSENTSEIDQFQYDEAEEVERKLRDQLIRVTSGAAPVSQLPRFTADPFRWVRLPTPSPPAAQTIDWGTASPATAAPAARPAVKSTVALRTALATSSLSDRLGSDPYALPADIVARHNLAKDDILAPKRSLSKPRAPQAPSTPASRPPTVDHTNVKMVQFKDPALIVKVDDGRIAFCHSCHRLVLGSGRGRCPHCGVVNDADDLPAAADDGSVPQNGAVQSNAAVEAASYAPRPLRPNATVEEIEAEERRLFQAAVAAWRTGAAPVLVAEGETEVAAARSSTTTAAKAFSTSARRVGQHIARHGLSAVYFSHLWGRAFPAATRPVAQEL